VRNADRNARIYGQNASRGVRIVATNIAHDRERLSPMIVECYDPMNLFEMPPNLGWRWIQSWLGLTNFSMTMRCLRR
jgi:hypothetical protein